jgi:hypothetical protein
LKTSIEIRAKKSKSPKLPLKSEQKSSKVQNCHRNQSQKVQKSKTAIEIRAKKFKSPKLPLKSEQKSQKVENFH